MKTKMNVIRLIVCLICVTGMAYAQEAPDSLQRGPQGKPMEREIPNPAKIATRMTDKMNEALQLTEKQYKKIYKLNLKEAKEQVEAMQERRAQRMPMGGPGMQGRRPPMMGGEPPMMGEGGFPEMAGRRMRPQSEEAEEARKEAAEKRKKAAEKKEKKLKKILTSEQYEKWQTEQAAAREKRKPQEPQV